MKKERSEYCQAQQFDYRNGKITGGLVRKSPHVGDTVYLTIQGMVLHLRPDEASAIIACLSEAMWTDMFNKLNPGAFTWKSHREMAKGLGGKP